MTTMVLLQEPYETTLTSPKLPKPAEIDQTEEIGADQQWETLFSQSQDILALLADEALKDLHEGRTEEIDWDQL
jgi:hypothetical protein